MTVAVDNKLNHYAIEGWLHHITHELAWPTSQDRKDWFTPALRETAKTVRMFALGAEMGSVVDRDPLPELGDVRPALYLDSLAERMAGPFWGRYTPEQRVRVREFAAGYLAGKMEKELRRLDQPPRVSKSKKKRRKGPGMAWIAAVVRGAETERRLVLVRAYLAAHADHEVVPAELRELTRLTFPAEARGGPAHPRDLPFF